MDLIFLILVKSVIILNPNNALYQIMQQQAMIKYQSSKDLNDDYTMFSYTGIEVSYEDPLESNLRCLILILVSLTVSSV